MNKSYSKYASDKPDHKFCSKCNNELHKDKFYKRNKGLLNRTSSCIDCSRVDNRNRPTEDGKLKCFRCEEVKNISCYIKNNNNKNGVIGICKQCKAIERKQQSESKDWDEIRKLITHKKCCTCKEELEVSLFSKRKSSDGYKAQCKSCASEYSKEYREKNKYILLEKRSKRKNSRTLHKKRPLTPYQKMIRNLRTRVIIAVKNQFTEKSKKTIELLGCDWSMLKDHLERQFVENMVWDNYGSREMNYVKLSWHIDHIIPCEMFDLSDPEQQRQCFHYTNLQPLWWYDNISKATRIYPTTKV
jgi:hypothetical protein